VTASRSGIMSSLTLRTAALICQTVSFFFQAGAGIRGYKVTGVQTCALPISRPPRSCPDCKRLVTCSQDKTAVVWDADTGQKLDKIGRASCRERVEIWEVAVSVKKKGITT